MSYLLRNLNILLVEDDPVIRLYMRLLLQEMHCRVLFTGSGEKAIEKFSNKVDGILMDVDLPGMGGCETAKMINHKNPNHKAIIYAFSACNFNVESHYLETGIRGLVKKPCQKSDLKEFLLLVSQKKNSSRGKSMPLN